MSKRRRKLQRVAGCGRDARKDNCSSAHMVRYSRKDEADAFDKLPRALRQWLNYAPSKFTALEITQIYRRQRTIERTLAILDAAMAKRFPDFKPI